MNRPSIAVTVRRAHCAPSSSSIRRQSAPLEFAACLSCREINQIGITRRAVGSFEALRRHANPAAAVRFVVQRTVSNDQATGQGDREPTFIAPRSNGLQSEAKKRWALGLAAGVAVLIVVLAPTRRFASGGTPRLSRNR